MTEEGFVFNAVEGADWKVPPTDQGSLTLELDTLGSLGSTVGNELVWVFGHLPDVEITEITITFLDRDRRELTFR